jgi:hypothetical protein
MIQVYDSVTLALIGSWSEDNIGAFAGDLSYPVRRLPKKPHPVEDRAP